MKRLIILLVSGICFLLANDLFAQNCTFTTGDTLLVKCHQRPACEHVDLYKFYYLKQHNLEWWTIGTPDTSYLFTGLQDTTTFKVSAHNGAGEGEHSDSVYAYWIPPEKPPVPSDIPYFKTASEIYAQKNKEWYFSHGAGNQKGADNIIYDVAFWVKRPEVGYPDTVYISTDLDIGQTDNYKFTFVLHRWAGAEGYLIVDRQKYQIPLETVLKDTLSLIVPLAEGTHEIRIQAEKTAMFLWNFRVDFADLAVPGKVIIINVEKQ